MSKPSDVKPKPILHDAVAFGLRMRLPDDALTKYAAGKWIGLKSAGEEVDDSGQRWALVRVPIGDKVHRDRSDNVHAIALVKGPDGYSVAKLEIPLAKAAEFTVESEGPDPSRGWAVDRAQVLIERGASEGGPTT